MIQSRDLPPDDAALTELLRVLARQQEEAAHREHSLDDREKAVLVRERAAAARETASAGVDRGGNATVDENLDRLREANEHLVLATVHAQTMTEEADEANHLKDQFLAVVSHELRTPLNVILGWAKMLGSTQLKPERTAHAISTIERNAASLARQIDDLLDVSRMIAGSVRLERRSVDLVTLIGNACDVVGPAAALKQVILECDCGPAASTLVSGDAERLQQVLVNLLSNAVTFTPSGGHVSVRVYDARAQVHIEVQDTGVGIPADFLPHVFERFSQASRGSTRRANGLGLGLAIVRQLVELHGGTVRAESEGERRGSRFTVSLPVATTVRSDNHPSTSPVDAASSSRRLDGLRVLAVEDGLDSRELLCEALEAEGALVTAVGSAQEALTAFSETAPDVLVSDIGLPGDDGYSLIRRIRAFEQERGGFVPAIAMTGYAFPEDVDRAMKAGFQQHVAKPIDPGKLTAAIVELVSQRHLAEL